MYSNVGVVSKYDRNLRYLRYLGVIDTIRYYQEILIVLLGYYANNRTFRRYRTFLSFLCNVTPKINLLNTLYTLEYYADNGLFGKLIGVLAKYAKVYKVYSPRPLVIHWIRAVIRRLG